MTVSRILRVVLLVALLLAVIMQLMINRAQIKINQALIQRIAALEGSGLPITKVTTAAQSPLAIGRILSAASTTPVGTPPNLTYKWERNEHSPSWEIEWNLIGSDAYVYALIMKSDYDSTWSVFHNGAGYGEFATKAAAMKRAEEVARQKGRDKM